MVVVVEPAASETVVVDVGVVDVGAVVVVVSADVVVGGASVEVVVMITTGTVDGVVTGAAVIVVDVVEPATSAALPAPSEAPAHDAATIEATRTTSTVRKVGFTRTRVQPGRAAQWAGPEPMLAAIASVAG